MPLYKTSKNILDKNDAIELILDIGSFAGGENTIGQDHDLKSNEARLIRNWDSSSVGGMIRSKGFSLVASNATGLPIDLLIQHFEGTSTEVYAIADGDLLIKDATDLTSEDASAFTSGILSHAVSAGSALWITNTSDNLKKKTIGDAIVTPTDVPPLASARIYEHNFRLIAEGSGKDVYGSRAGVGNWDASGAWSTNNDSWSMTMPDLTQGSVPGFPSGTDLTVFTKFDTFVIYNQPNVARRRITNGIGCCAPYTVTKGNEGIFFVSNYPTLGVFLWDSVSYINLTINHDFVDDINLSQRIFGIYRDRKYYLFYASKLSAASYPDTLKIYDTAFGRWSTRTINSSVVDTFGYPALLTKSNNELYSGSSQLTKVYEIDDETTSDNGYNTNALYRTKVFTSKDWRLTIGGQVPVDNVRLKLIKATATYYGVDGDFILNWIADRGIRTGSQTFPFQAVDGDLINVNFIVNTSEIIETSDFPDRRVTKSFNNSAVGREFQFEFVNSDDGVLTEIKNLKILAIALEEE